MGYGEDEVTPGGFTRRQLLKSMALAGAGLAVASAVVSGKMLLPPPVIFRGEVRDTFVYAAGEGGPGEKIWWNPLAGQEVSLAHFTEAEIPSIPATAFTDNPLDPMFRGMPAVWRGMFDEEGSWVAGSGMTALLIRVPADRFTAPGGYEGVIEVPATGDQPASVIVGIYDRCVHLCCNPGWHVKAISQEFKIYITNPRTLLYGQDPIWCQCHNSQYDPMTLVENEHPNKQAYVGAKMVHGPASRALPAIPIKVEGTKIVGIYGTKPDDPFFNAPWYSAYCK